MNSKFVSRRQCLAASAGGAAAFLSTSFTSHPLAELWAAEIRGAGMAYGLVTYQWGKDWSLAELFANCEKADVLGVELRTTHAHGVEPTLNKAQREEVRRRFANSPVTLVGLGSNERFDNPDPDVVAKAIEASKAFIRLSHDVGGSGVKVKPDRFYPDVPREKTIEQIGTALNKLGEYGEGFGQQVRLEVHGQCAELPTIKSIMEVADNRNVAICWNSNKQDLAGDGLAANFKLVRDRFGATCHVRELDSKDYPYTELIGCWSNPITTVGSCSSRRRSLPTGSRPSPLKRSYSIRWSPRLRTANPNKATTHTLAEAMPGLSTTSGATPQSLVATLSRDHKQGPRCSLKHLGCSTASFRSRVGKLTDDRSEYVGASILDDHQPTR